MVDGSVHLAEIIEQRTHRGTIEWDAMNRKRAGGAVTDLRVDGGTISISAKLCSYPVNFGAVAGEIDEQALEGVETNTVSPDTGIAVYRGRDIPDSPYHRRIKTEIISREEVEAEEKRPGIRHLDSTRNKGRIGALGAVLWGNRGIEAVGLYGEHL